MSELLTPGLYYRLNELPYGSVFEDSDGKPTTWHPRKVKLIRLPTINEETQGELE
jgi:hypothetical protein